MRLQLNPLVKVFLAVLLIMPLTLGVWWFLLRDYLVLLLQQGVVIASHWLWPDYVLAIDTDTDARSGAIVWIVKTSLSPISDPRQLLAIPISTSRFTVSFPLLWGLILATPTHGNKERQLFLGSLVLVPITLTIALLIIQFKLALNINHEPILTEFPIGDYLLVLPYSSWLYYLMAVGRQVSMLVLPTLAPLMVWGLFNRMFIRGIIFEGLLTRSTEHFRTPPPPPR